MSVEEFNLIMDYLEKQFDNLTKSDLLSWYDMD